jgi:hypothetical protein
MANVGLLRFRVGAAMPHYPGRTNLVKSGCCNPSAAPGTRQLPGSRGLRVPKRCTEVSTARP